jgi:predicted Zn-dependent protease
VHDYNPDAAGPLYEQAVRRNPEDPSAQWWYGCYLDGVGRPDAAVARLQRGAKAEPGCAALLTDMAVVFANCREYPQAIRRCQEALEIEPASAVAHFVMAEVLLACGQVGRALRMLERVRAFSPGSARAIAMNGWAFGVTGQRERAEKALAELSAMASTQYVSAFEFARMYIGLGDRDAAFRWLAQALRERSPQLAWHRRLRVLDPLRLDPRFSELQARIVRSSQ